MMVAMRAAMAEQRGKITRKRDSKSSVFDVVEGADIYNVKVTPRGLTLAGSVKLDKELGHAIVDEIDVVIGHQPGPPRT